MPTNNYHPLPDFSSIIRWTVQDVINWLEKNKLSSCGKLFRDAGIDGNKLYNSTEADLIEINCPKRELGIIVDLLKQVQPQTGQMSSCAKAESRAIMKAVRVHQFGAPEVLQVETNIPIPEPAGSQPGDRVYLIGTLTGSYAEYSLADEEKVQPLSEKLTFQQGAGLGVPCYSAYRALCIKARDKIKPGTTVLIHGASGAVGLACVQIAAARGLTVIGTAGSQAGLHLIMQHGASAAFNHQEPSYIDQIVAASGGVGPDMIIEMLANVNLEKDLMMAARNARIVVVGNRGSIEINPQVMMQKEVSVTGMALWNATEDEWREMHAGVADGVRQGWLQPHICKEYPLEEAPTAHHDVIHAGASLGKRVFVL